jgi:hypothetical protein
MRTLLQHLLTLWVFFSPFAIPAAGISLLRRTERHSWLIHGAVLIAMLSPIPTYIAGMALFDPTTIEGANGGEGFLVLLHVPLMIGTMIWYTIYVWQRRPSGGTEKAA